MKWLWVVLLAAVLLIGAVWYFQINSPVEYSTDVVYLTRYASVMTASGVYGFPPGTRLLLDSSRRAVPGAVAVTDGTRKLDVEASALTRNPKIAQDLADADRQGQSRAVAGVAAAKAHVVNGEYAAQMARARDIDRLNATQRSLSAPTSTPPPSPPATPHRNR